LWLPEYFKLNCAQAALSPLLQLKRRTLRNGDALAMVSGLRKKAARRRLFKSNLMIVDQATFNAGFDVRR
jgi:hypothetical protein